MRIALENVERFYPVVGITEHMNMTLKVLEKVMPEYFEGATEAYYKSNFVLKGRHKTTYKKTLSEDTLSILRKNFTHEIEFYQFCKQRLQTQYDQLFPSQP